MAVSEAGISGYPLELVQVEPQRVGDDRLDHVPVAARPGRPLFGPRRSFHSRTAATARCCTAAMDSPSGNVTALGCGLHHRPQRLLGELLELGRPVHVAVVALPEPLVGQHRHATPPAATAWAVSWQRSSGLETMASSSSGRQPLGQRRRLRPSRLAEMDAGGPAGQDRPGEVGQAVSGQQQGRHAGKSLQASTPRLLSRLDGNLAGSWSSAMWAGAACRCPAWASAR